jgi:hypothetical protein
MNLKLVYGKRYVCVSFLIYICDATLFFLDKFDLLHNYHLCMGVCTGPDATAYHEYNLIYTHGMGMYLFQIMLENLLPIISEKSVTQCS